VIDSYTITVDVTLLAAWPVDSLQLLQWFADKDKAKSAGKGRGRAVVMLADGRRVTSRSGVQIGGSLRPTFSERVRLMVLRLPDKTRRRAAQSAAPVSSPTEFTGF
jgi:hypothetical protein